MPSLPAIGDSLGAWTLERVLGEGGMARVFVARNPDGRQVALKVLTLSEELIAQRFVQEARLLGRVRHPHLVRVFDTGVADAHPWLAMELLSGRTLSQVIRERAPFSLEDALPLFSQVADALSALHASRVVHRDLKPGNVMVSDQGWATLLDLGIAREGEGGLTQTGVVIGTPGYMAPEQILADKNISPAADVYAFAVMLWRALVGAPIFKARGDALLTEHLTAPRPLLRDVRPELPGGLTTLFVDALAIQPSQRPQTMGALWEALELALEGTTRVPTRHSKLEWIEPTRNDRPVDPGTPTPQESTAPEARALPEPSSNETVQHLQPVNAETALQLPQVVTNAETAPFLRGVGPAPSLSRGDSSALKWLGALTAVVVLLVLAGRFFEPAPPPLPTPMAEPRGVPGAATKQPALTEAPVASEDLLARREKVKTEEVAASKVGRDGFSADKLKMVKPRRLTQERGRGAENTVEIVVTMNEVPLKADVTIDGRFAGIAPAVTHITPGRHAGRVDAGRGFPTYFEFVASGAPVRLEIDLTPR